MDPGPPTRALIVSDVRLYGESLRRVLASRPDLEVLDVIGNAMEAGACLGELEPDVVLLDPAMPDSESLCRLVHGRPGGTKVVVLGLSPVEDEAVHWIRCGAHGFVTRGQSVDDVVATIQGVAHGLFRCSPRVARALMRELAGRAGRPDVDGDPSTLTRREREVSRLLAQGMSNKQVARTLGIAVSTAKNHVHNILAKTGLDRRGQVGGWLRRHGIPVVPAGPDGRAAKDERAAPGDGDPGRVRSDLRGGRPRAARGST